VLAGHWFYRITSYYVVTHGPTNGFPKEIGDLC
jgi:hypothetical protein